MVTLNWGTISARLAGGWTGRNSFDMDMFVGNGTLFSYDPAEEKVIHPLLWQLNRYPNLISLLPQGATAATVTDMSSNLQVGQAVIGDSTRAIIWQGSASSAQDVTPASASSAGIAAISGAWQAGYAIFADSTSRSAVVWQGSAASFRNVHPANATASWLLGTDGDQFVGVATIGERTGAALWTKAAPAGFISLHPRDMIASEARSTNSGYQAGSVTVAEGGTHAAFWQGTAASFLDLHKALPPEYSKSEATYVYLLKADRYFVGNGGTIIYGPVTGDDKPSGALLKFTWEEVTTPSYVLVGGSAYNSERECWEAIMWQVRELEPPVLRTLSREAVGASKNIAVGLTRRVVVRTNGKRRVVRGADFRRKVRIATQRGRVLLGSRRTFNEFKIRGLKRGRNDVIITATGPGGRAKPLRLKIRR